MHNKISETSTSFSYLVKISGNDYVIEVGKDGSLIEVKPYGSNIKNMNSSKEFG